MSVFAHTSAQNSWGSEKNSSGSGLYIMKEVKIKQKRQWEKKGNIQGKIKRHERESERKR